MIFRKAVKEDFDNIKSLYWELIDQEAGDPSFPHWKKEVSILLMKCCVTVLIRRNCMF